MIKEFRPQMDAVIIQLIDDKPVIIIEYMNADRLPALQELAHKIRIAI